MSTINMKLLGKLVSDAAAAFEKWKVAGAFALTKHAAYAAAIKTNQVARAAAEEVRGFGNGALTQLHSDPDTDPSWFAKIGAIRDHAIYQVKTLDHGLELVKADLLQFAKFFTPADQKTVANAPTPEAAAAAVDAAAKKPEYRGLQNPNAQTPGSQSSSNPAEDAPPGDDSMATGTKIGLFAAAGLAAAWLARRVMS